MDDHPSILVDEEFQLAVPSNNFFCDWPAADDNGQDD
jgi:hypothetical protein